MHPIEEGPWKLVVQYGKTAGYALYHLVDDPQTKNDLAKQMEHIVFRLRGRLERREAAQYKVRVRTEEAGK